MSNPTFSDMPYEIGLHCCVCTASCNHTGGPYYCEVHNPNRRLRINIPSVWLPWPEDLTKRLLDILERLESQLGDK